MTDAITAELLTPHIGESIELVREDHTFTARIAEVNPLRQDNNQTRQPFSLILNTNCPVDVPQGVFTGKHEKIGELSLFLVPVDQTDDGLVFEGVFN